MASFEERIYELGSQALAEQERQVSEVRGRGSALLAAAAVIASLLARPVFSGAHPDGVLEWVAMARFLVIYGRAPGWRVERPRSRRSWLLRGG